MLVTSMLLVVFFFKQKTAYEMRISDWSSDVCSSDLFVTARHIVGEHLRRSRIVAIDLVADLDSLNIVDDEISAHRRLSGQEELARRSRQAPRYASLNDGRRSAGRGEGRRDRAWGGPPLDPSVQIGRAHV